MSLGCGEEWFPGAAIIQFWKPTPVLWAPCPPPSLPTGRACGFSSRGTGKKGGILFTYPLSGSQLFKAPPCNVLRIAGAPRSPAVLSAVPWKELLRGASRVEVLRCRSWDAGERFKTWQADSKG